MQFFEQFAIFPISIALMSLISCSNDEPMNRRSGSQRAESKRPAGRPMTYDELVNKMPGAKIYMPDPLPGAIYEDVEITNPFTGRKSPHGTRVTDPATGDQLAFYGHGSDPGDLRGQGNPRYQFSNGNRRGDIVAGYYVLHSLRDPDVSVVEIKTVDKRGSQFRRSEFDATRLAQMFRAHLDAANAYHHQKFGNPLNTQKRVVIDSRPE